MQGYFPYRVDWTSLKFMIANVLIQLDMKLRLRIRDSLFRLAQSAMQRHHASDTGSTNKSSRDEHEVIAKEEINSCNRLVH